MIYYNLSGQSYFHKLRNKIPKRIICGIEITLNKKLDVQQSNQGQG